MNDPEIVLWFSEWNRVEAVAIAAAVFFAAAVVMMRLLGKRTTARMNNFDWIITVAMGSLIASAILSKSVSIADALTAMAVLGLCQWSTTWLVMQFPPLARLVKPTPRLLLRDGTPIARAMRKERISVDELYGRLRQHGFTNLSEVKWVILETDGQFTMIPARGEETDLVSADLMGNIKGESGLVVQADDQS